MTSAVLQVMPDMDAETRRALRESIQAFGVLMPIVVDQGDRIIDGHNRSEIAEELGVTCERIVRHVESDEEARELARTLNLDRRHLPRETRAALAQHLRRQRHSLRAISGALGVSQETVRTDLQLSSDLTVEDPSPMTVTGLDGKERPSSARLSDADRDAAADRVLAGEKQCAVAAELGVSPSAVSGWVKARRDEVTALDEVDLSGRTRASQAARVGEIRRLAAEGYSSRQLAERFGLSRPRIKDICAEHDIDVPADRVIGRSRLFDSNRAVQGVVDGLPSGAVISAINFAALDEDQLNGWVISLSDAIRSLTTLRNNLKKEMTSRG